MRTQYRPYNGGLPARVIAWLQTQPPGAMPTTEHLAWLFNLPRADLIHRLQQAVDAGWLIVSAAPGHDPGKRVWRLPPELTDS